MLQLVVTRCQRLRQALKDTNLGRMQISMGEPEALVRCGLGCVTLLHRPYRGRVLLSCLARALLSRILGEGRNGVCSTSA